MAPRIRAPRWPVGLAFFWAASSICIPGVVQAAAASADNNGPESSRTEVARRHPLGGIQLHAPTLAAVAGATSRFHTSRRIPGATRHLLYCQGELILADAPAPERVVVSVVIDERGRAKAARMVEPEGPSPLGDCLVPALLRLQLASAGKAVELRQRWDLRLD